jgi:hypothetical protein
VVEGSTVSKTSHLKLPTVGSNLVHAKRVPSQNQGVGQFLHLSLSRSRVGGAACSRDMNSSVAGGVKIETLE